ncbi:MAG: hypothetical protein HQK76_13405 [Desulfobacterales bacterium]|nr:hypothetical protein [Desulfobacterales bacterium]
MDEINSETNQYYEGIEAGSVSVKWVRIEKNGNIQVEIFRHEGDLAGKINTIFADYSNAKNNGAKIVMTGQTAKNFLKLPYRAETECLEKALSHYNLKPDILLSLGGETFTVYSLKDGYVKNIMSSSKCAAGTGEFVVQQFQRMGLSLEDGIKLSHNGRIVPLASRCSVYCKSDATHKLNKGECSPEDIAKSLIYDLAKKVCKMIESARWPSNTIVISGGLTLNKPFIDALTVMLENSKIHVLEESPYLEAFGAALYASQDDDAHSKDQIFHSSKSSFETLPPLKNVENLLDWRVKENRKKEIASEKTYILGVDAGSTTTKAVLFNIEDGSVDASCYLRTHGNPVQATKNCIQKLMEQKGDKSLKIIQTAVTGSGREMVSVYLDNCLSFNEILAHARAASQEIPEVDTVFEIGGQDSKFISFLKGIPIDYAMNEGCSAGTGSFLEESVSVDMGIPVGKIANIAEKGTNPIAFGERCAAFINTDLRNALQNGAHQDDVVAGLVYSIADNYISRIVGVRSLGDTILFQGGVALNRAVALAMAARTGRKIVVPSYPELMGCVGAALMAKDLMEDGDTEQRDDSLERFSDGAMELKGDFKCASCENKCEIKKISIRDKIYPFGGLCSKYEISRHKRKIDEGINLVAIRNKIMFEDFAPEPLKNPKGIIGIPLALTTYEFFPFYAKLINEMGYNILLSEPSKKGNDKILSPTCYPLESAHGAIFDLINRNVDFIFFPRFIESNVPNGYLNAYTCPSIVMAPDVVGHALKKASSMLLSPHIGFSKKLSKTTYNEIERMGDSLGLSKLSAISAFKNALKHYEKFKKSLMKATLNEMEKIKYQPTVIIAGRPYTICSSEVNLALDRKISSRGYHVIPADMVPEFNFQKNNRNMWYVTQQIMNGVFYAKNNPDVYVCMVSCFSCAPDASMCHIIRRELSGETFCYLEIDSHTAHAGFETRVGAFLDIIEEKRRKTKKEKGA